MARGSNFTGNGGEIEVTLDQGASIVTGQTDAAHSSPAGNAPGIIAQSVGGGGGWFANRNAANIGSAGGSGMGGRHGHGQRQRHGRSAGVGFGRGAGAIHRGRGQQRSGAGQQIVVNVGSASNTSAAVSFRNGSTNPLNPNTLTNYATIAPHDTA